MIAAESVYLNEEKSELKFRLSLFASIWDDGITMSRRDTFAIVKKAYDLRSKVVHGGIVGTVEIEDLVVKLKDILRHGINKAIDHLDDGVFPPDWEQELFKIPNLAN